jgi:predicted DNA-binding transcriptional regulator AlpA
MEYAFTLKYSLAAEDSDHAQLVERLAQAGCDDATIGIGQTGRIALAFTRDSANAWSAIYTAMQDVKQAIPAARLVEAGPDFVGLTDAAEIVGMTRQNMRKLMLAYTTEFPAPVHDGNPSIWYLSDILGWLNGRGTYHIDADLFEIARSTKQVNLAKQARGIESRVKRQLDTLLA